MTTTRAPAETASASVAVGDQLAVVRDLPLGDCGPDAGWLRVEASGICGTDVGLFTDPDRQPTVLGHHVLGQVAALGDAAAERWRLSPGDWVVVEEYLPCGTCAMCRDDRYRLCPQTDLWKGGRRIGTVPVSEEPGLWGGNAQYLYLAPNAVPHRVPDGVPPQLAVWALPLANVLDWVLGAGQMRAGDTLVVIGPGYHGIAAAALAAHVGARQVVVCGLERDRPRLALAETFGAATLELPDAGKSVAGAGNDNGAGRTLAAAVAELTDGAMADVVLDLAASGPETVTDSLDLLGQGGRLVLAGAKSPPVAGIDTSILTRLTAAVVGVRGRAPDRVRQSIELLGHGGVGLGSVPTEQVPLAGVGPMLARMARGDGPDTPHVVVRPWLD